MCIPNSYVVPLTPSVAVFGDTASKEIIKVKCGCKSGSLIHLALCYKKHQRAHTFSAM